MKVKLNPLTRLFMEQSELFPHLFLDAEAWRTARPIDFPEKQLEMVEFDQALERIFQIWDEVGESLAQEAENKPFYDSDGVEVNGVDLLAYYVTFRSIRADRENQNWGIHFNLKEFFAFVRRVAKSANKPAREALSACYFFVLHHEINHYEIDLGTFFLEAHSGRSGYLTRQVPVEVEEALGSGRGVTRPEVKEFKDVIVYRYESTSLRGYRDLGKYLTRKRQESAFNEILFQNVPSAKKNFPLAHQFMKPRSPFNSKNIPIYLHM